MKSAILVLNCLLTLTISVLSAPIPVPLSEQTRSAIQVGLIGGLGGLSAALASLGFCMFQGIVNSWVVTKGIDHGIARMMQYDQWKKELLTADQIQKGVIVGNGSAAGAQEETKETEEGIGTDKKRS